MDHQGADALVHGLCYGIDCTAGCIDTVAASLAATVLYSQKPNRADHMVTTQTNNSSRTAHTDFGAKIVANMRYLKMSTTH